MYNNKVPQTLKEQEIFYACRRFEDAVKIYGADTILKALDSTTLHDVWVAVYGMFDLGDEGSSSRMPSR